MKLDKIKIIKKQMEVDKLYLLGLIFLVPIVYTVALLFLNWWAINIGLIIVAILFYKTHKRKKELERLKK